MKRLRHKKRRELLHKKKVEKKKGMLLVLSKDGKSKKQTSQSSEKTHPYPRVQEIIRRVIHLYDIYII